MSHNDSSSDYSSLESNPPSPTNTRLRRQPTPIRLHSIGIDPKELVGKVITRIRRSSSHPALTLDFSDHTAFQVLVDGYDPDHPGIPKDLEMDPLASSLFNPPSGQLHTSLTIQNSALITLTDRAFHIRQAGEEKWDQNHLGIAFKFAERAGWHCVWATLAEYDKIQGMCVFRSYDDVYLQKLERTPRKKLPKRRA